MKVSIITVVFNNKETIKDAILSVYEQTYKNVEHIIIDGGSTDGTKEILEKERDKFAILVSESDKGIYDAMNKGVLMATGDVIGILNSDDLYADNMVLQDVVSCFAGDSGLSIVYGDLVYVKSDNTNSIVRKWMSKPYYDCFFENGNVPPHPTLFLRNNIYKEVGLFDLEYKLAADYELMLRIFKKHHFRSKYLQRLIIKMRLGGATNKSSINIFNQNKEILRSWRNNGLKAPLYLMPLRVFKRLSQFFYF